MVNFFGIGGIRMMLNTSLVFVDELYQNLIGNVLCVFFNFCFLILIRIGF